MNDSERAKRFHDEKWEAITNAMRLVREARSDIFDQHLSLARVEGRLTFLAGDFLGKPLIENSVARESAKLALTEVAEAGKAVFEIIETLSKEIDNKLLV